jgi:hypothetical protein
MDKKEINSPKLAVSFVFWVAGIGGVSLAALLHRTVGGSSFEYTHLTHGPLKPIAAVGDPP